MVDIFNYRNLVPDNYSGRSPRDEFFYNRTPTSMTNTDGTPIILGNVPFKYMRGQHLNPHKNRNFSALPQTEEEKQAIINQSWIRNNLPIPTSTKTPLNYRNMTKAENLFQGVPSQTETTGAVDTPPNWKDNLLKYIVSPKGQGMSQGLLEASGYSDMPVSFGQALALGMQRGNEAEARESKTQIERDKFAFDKSQATIQNLFTQQGLDLELQKILKPELSAFAKDLIAAGIDPNSEEGRDLLKAKINKATNTISIINPKETDEKIRLEEFKADKKIVGDEKKFFNSSREINSKLIQMKGLIEKGLQTNKFAPWKETMMAVLNSADFLTDQEKSELADLENFGAMAAYMAPRMRAIGSGATSDFEVGMFIKAAPALAKTTEGNLKIIAGMMQLNDFNMRKYKAMDRWLNEHKTLGINTKEKSKGEGLTFEEYWTEETGDTIFQRYTTEEDFEKLKTEGKVKANQYVIYVDEDGIENLIWMKPDMFKEDN